MTGIPSPGEKLWTTGPFPCTCRPAGICEAEERFAALTWVPRGDCLRAAPRRAVTLITGQTQATRISGSSVGVAGMTRFASAVITTPWHPRCSRLLTQLERP